jgi:hypothetical protein
MQRNGLLRYVTVWTALGTLAVLAALLAIWGLALRSLAPEQTVKPPAPTAVVNVILAPTPTPVIQITPSPEATATTPPTGGLSTPVTNAKIKVGDYVQISGTGGDGLRIRSGAGTSNAPNFLGMESEVFQVVGGPQDADGITWWSLAAPYDETRKGWAASNYLTVVAQKP